MKTLSKLHLLIAAVAAILLTGCSGKTITFNNTDFSAYTDPVFDIVRELCSDFDVEERSVLSSSFYDCKVSVTLEPEKYLATTVRSSSNETKSIVYERSITKIDDETYNAEFKLYNPVPNYVISDFLGVVHADALGDFDEEQFKESFKDINWENGDYYDCFNAYYFNKVISGELKFYTKKDGLKEPLVTKAIQISDYQVIVTDYWDNGQKKIVKEFNRNDREITAAYNYNEDGSIGNPLEIAALINDRWIGFTSNLHDNWTKEQVYLILRTEKGDWRHGKVMICHSESGCQSDYTCIYKGDYEIDDSMHIRLYNMKNNRGNYANEGRLSIEGDSMTNITIRGVYDDLSCRFVSDLNMKNKSWLKSSLISKHNMR